MTEAAPISPVAGHMTGKISVENTNINGAKLDGMAPAPAALATDP